VVTFAKLGTAQGLLVHSHTVEGLSHHLCMYEMTVTEKGIQVTVLCVTYMHT